MTIRTITPGCTCAASDDLCHEEHTTRCGWVTAGFPQPARQAVRCPRCPAAFNPGQYIWDITARGAQLPQHACVSAR